MPDTLVERLAHLDEQLLVHSSLRYAAEQRGHSGEALWHSNAIDALILEREDVAREGRP